MPENRIRAGLKQASAYHKTTATGTDPDCNRIYLIKKKERTTLKPFGQP